VIPDFTPDVSHIEQLSLTIRYVSRGQNVPAGVYEHFINFLPVSESTGASLLQVMLAELEEHGLNVNDIRGEGYDNGANMKGKQSGVQVRVLQLNPRAFFTPCVCYNYTLLLGDLAASCSQTISVFGVLQRIYVFFAALTHRWNVFKQHVKNLSVKPLSDTRRECCIESVKAICYQPVEIRDALTQAAAATKEPLSRSEAKSLCNEIENFQFIVALVFWHDILFQVNYISKQLQGESSDLPDAIENLDRLSQSIAMFESDGFESAIVTATELAESLEIDPVFPARRMRKKKRTFDYEGIDKGEKSQLMLKTFSVSIDSIRFLTPLFHQSTQDLSNRKQFTDYSGFCTNFKFCQRMS
jgi:hypothetical protein